MAVVKSIVKVNIRVLEIACVHACVQWGGGRACTVVPEHVHRHHREMDR